MNTECPCGWSIFPKFTKVLAGSIFGMVGSHTHQISQWLVHHVTHMGRDREKPVT